MKVVLEKNRVQKMASKAIRGVPPKKHDDATEKALIVAYLNGDEGAGMELAENFLDFFSVIMNKPTDVPFKSPAMQQLWCKPSFQDKEDLFQEILFHFFKMVKEYDPETAPFASFIGSTLKQRVFNNFFSEFLRVSANEDLISEDNIEVFNASIEVLPKSPPSEHIGLYKALDKLSKRQREAIELSIIKGWDSSIVAEELGEKPATIRKRKERGLEKLKNIMKTNEEE